MSHVDATNRAIPPAGQPTDPASLKERVRAFWNEAPCGTAAAEAPRYSRPYFDEIEAERYRLEPEIFSFAQFTRHRGKEVLEVGIGAATDFLQWVRAGVHAYGVDLTEAAVEHARRRLEVYGLAAEDLRVADCENLPYPDARFDLVYSWGVIHHTPDTARALAEICRVLRPGGAAKVMIYHRHSLFAALLWVRRALLTGRPWKPLAWAVWDIESPGTKAYTRAEAARMLSALPVEEVRLATRSTWCDRLATNRSRFVRVTAGTAARLLGDRAGWFMLIEFKRAAL